MNRRLSRSSGRSGWRREADVYLYLAKSEAQPATTIARGLSMHKAQVYRLVKNLQVKGFLEASLETPTRFSVLSFDQLLDLHVKVKQEELLHLQGYRRDTLLAQWQSMLSNDFSLPSEKFIAFEGRERFYSKLLQMEREVQKKRDIVTTIGNFVQMERYGYFHLVETSTARIQSRIIVEVTKDNLAATKRVLFLTHQNTEINQIQIRHHHVVSQRFPRFQIQDEKEVLLGYRRILSPRPEDVFGFWSNSSGIVNAFRVLFNELWRDAVDIDERISELENTAL
jgi:sugar-specific transcriptional regulator TrmB